MEPRALNCFSIGHRNSSSKTQIDNSHVVDHLLYSVDWLSVFEFTFSTPESCPLFIHSLSHSPLSNLSLQFSSVTRCPGCLKSPNRFHKWPVDLRRSSLVAADSTLNAAAPPSRPLSVRRLIYRHSSHVHMVPIDQNSFCSSIPQTE